MTPHIRATSFELLRMCDIERRPSTMPVPLRRLHADSWRRHYRGAYAGLPTSTVTLLAERLEVMDDSPCSSQAESVHTVCADADGNVVGFAHTDVRPRSEVGSLTRQSARPKRSEGIGDRHTAALGGSHGPHPTPANGASLPVGARSEHRCAEFL